MFVDAGCQGRIFDSGGFTNTELYKKLEVQNLTSSSAGPFRRERKKCSVLAYWRPNFSFKRESHESLFGTTLKGLKRRYFQLQDLQSPRSWRKCI